MNLGIQECKENERRQRVYDRMSRWHFVTSCVNCPAEDVDSLIACIENARQITRAAFVRQVDRTEREAVERSLGYTTNIGRTRGPHMAHDWHVSYYRSTFRGQPCVFFNWSAIEYIFQPEGNHA